MNNKKGQNIVVVLILSVIAIVVLGTLATKLLGKSGKEVLDLTSNTEDPDGDGVANAFDDCICSPGDIDNNGCPVKIDTEEAKIKYKERLKTLAKQELSCKEIDKRLIA
ncbi:hypothetical protein GOV14_04725 [Candidatus Pacearchaeota archaeon]|nr:hypothetical protein [Candidatus Pacearchaeota archaeon]